MRQPASVTSKYEYSKSEFLRLLGLLEDSTLVDVYVSCYEDTVTVTVMDGND